MESAHVSVQDCRGDPSGKPTVLKEPKIGVTKDTQELY